MAVLAFLEWKSNLRGAVGDSTPAEAFGKLTCQLSTVGGVSTANEGSVRVQVLGFRVQINTELLSPEHH
jgi:hypothetical protein